MTWRKSLVLEVLEEVVFFFWCVWWVFCFFFVVLGGGVWVCFCFLGGGVLRSVIGEFCNCISSSFFSLCFFCLDSLTWGLVLLVVVTVVFTEEANN